MFSRPYFVALVTKLGEPGADGISDHSFGFAILSPDRLNYRYLAHQEEEDLVARLEVVETMLVNWFGVSYAYRTSSTSALGASLFLTYLSEDYQEDQTRAAAGAIGDTNLGQVATNSTVLHYAAMHVLLRLGGKLQLSEAWSLGAMVQPPGPPIWSGGYSSVLRTEVSPDGTSSFQSSYQEELDESRWMPWELRAGATLSDTDNLLSVNASVLGPQAGDASGVPSYTYDNSSYGFVSSPVRTSTVYVFLSGGAEAAMALTSADGG
jgi:hypothetical protein